MKYVTQFIILEAHHEKWILDIKYLKTSDCLAIVDKRDGKDRMCLYNAKNYSLLKVNNIYII
jgi:hypothetical protein